MISQHQRETAFLRQVLLYEDTPERYQLEERIAQDQRNERCARRAVWLMAFLAALAFGGLCYSAIFLPDFPQNKPHFIAKIFAVLGLGSLICLPAFVGCWGGYRRKLNQRREECRRLATQFLEARLRKPATPHAAHSARGSGEDNDLASVTI